MSEPDKAHWWAGYQEELDSAHAKLRAKDEEIAELHGRLDTAYAVIETLQNKLDDVPVAVERFVSDVAQIVRWGEACADRIGTVRADSVEKEPLPGRDRQERQQEGQSPNCSGPQAQCQVRVSGSTSAS